MLFFLTANIYNKNPFLYSFIFLDLDVRVRMYLATFEETNYAVYLLKCLFGFLKWFTLFFIMDTYNVINVKPIHCYEVNSESLRG